MRKRLVAALTTLIGSALMTGTAIGWPEMGG